MAIPKKKPKTRNWRCQAEHDGKRCKSRALIEHERKIGSTTCDGKKTFKVPLKLKLCLLCSRELSALLNRLFDARSI